MDPAAPPPAPPPLPHRLAVRRLMRGCSKATLATLLTQPAWPYASLVTVATAQDGSPILLLSGLSDHTRNLTADARVSLLFDGTAGFPNPQQGPRVTILGHATPAPDATLRRRFLARHPAAALYADFGDFTIYRVSVKRAHYVGGFARAVWLDDGLTVEADTAEAMAMAEDDILAHMNCDHADALDLLARSLLGRDGNGWRMVAIDADGFDLANNDEVVRLAFDMPIDGPGAARQALVALTKKAGPGA